MLRRPGALHGAAIAGVERHSFPLFFGAFALVFLFSGAGNGSTYRMIPSIFAALGRRNGGDPLEYKRRSAAAIGIAGAVGALGGFMIQLAFRQASLPVVHALAAAKKTVTSHAEVAHVTARIATAHATWSIPALWVFLVGYVALGGLTWFCYVRRGVLMRRFPNFAAEAV